jgi:hypothetical protein
MTIFIRIGKYKVWTWLDEMTFEPRNDAIEVEEVNHTLIGKE